MSISTLAQRCVVAVLAVGVLVVAAACGPDSSDDDPSALAALPDRLENMAFTIVRPIGASTVETIADARIWALALKDDMSSVASANCSLDGSPMEDASELFVVEHTLVDVPANDTDEPFHSFAQAHAADQGIHTIECDLPATRAVVIAVEPR